MTINPNNRWQTHIMSANRGDDKPLYQAMRKYGINNFLMEILVSDIKSEQDALLIESDLIKELNTLVVNKNGYNILASSGGRQIINGKFLCSKCNLEKDITCFYKNKNTISGLYFWCIVCQKEYDAQYYEKNKSLILEKKKDYWGLNKEKLSIKKKVYYQNNKDDLLDYNSVYYSDNKSSILEGKKVYYLQNKEDILLKKKNYYLKNKEAILARRKLKRDINNEKSSSGSDN